MAQDSKPAEGGKSSVAAKGPSAGEASLLRIEGALDRLGKAMILGGILSQRPSTSAGDELRERVEKLFALLSRPSAD